MTGTAPGHVLLVAANPAGASTGNERTMQRIRRLLRAAGVRVRIARPGDDPRSLAAAGAIDLIHAFHARRSGPRALEIGAVNGAPVVVSVTGTDLGVDLLDAGRADIVRDVLLRASGVACGNEQEAELTRSLVVPSTPVVVVPKGVALVGKVAPSPAAAGEGPLVLCVAHLRRVKRLDVAVLAMRRLHLAGRRVRLAILGDVLDEVEAARLQKLVGDAAWVDVFRGPIASSQMGGWLAAADVVLNTSDVEGGSNAVLEAMAAGRALVASDIPGNAHYVGRDGSRGLLYSVERTVGDGFVHGVGACADAIARLLDDPRLRAELGAAAREYVRTAHSPEGERAALLDLYVRAAASSPRS